MDPLHDEVKGIFEEMGWNAVSSYSIWSLALPITNETVCKFATYLSTIIL